MKIECKNVTKKFGEQTVVSDVTCTFEAGKIYGINGRNGSGKSVFLKLICGQYVPTSGEILYDGVNLNQKNAYPQNVRALIENPAFFPDLTGLENLKVLAKIQNKTSDEDIEKALLEVNLGEEKNKRYSKYSLGMKQKLGIAQVIMDNPDILVFDEPFNGIERASVEKISLFLKQKKEENKMIIVSSHIKEDLENLCDKMIYFDDGKIVENENITK